MMRRLVLSLLMIVIGLALVFILFEELVVEMMKHPSAEQRADRRGHQTSKYRVVEGSDIQTQFGATNVYECKQTRTKLSEIQRNNINWQVVRLRNIYLYSSFFDVRFRYDNVTYQFVRVLASSRGHLSEPVAGLRRENLYCHLWFNNTEGSTIVKASTQEIWMKTFDPQPPYKTYHSYLISCPVPHEYKHNHMVPTHVSVTANICEQITTYIPVTRDGLQELRSGYKKDQYLICVKALNFEEDISKRLVEWIELNLLLGANGIDFYVYTVHPNTRKTLEFYERQNLVNVIDITLPGDQPNDQRRTQYIKFNVWQKRRSELIPYNDCLYRNMYSYNFVIPLDVDEIILPKIEKTWNGLFKRLFRKDQKLLRKYASLSVPNVYFYDKWNMTTKKNNGSNPIYANPETFWLKNETIEEEKFYMLNHLQRTANYSLPGHHVKSFVSTKNTLLTFNHYALSPLHKDVKRNVILDKELVQLNHYQEKCSRYLLSQCLSNFNVYSIQDDALLKYEGELRSNVNLAHQRLLG